MQKGVVGDDNHRGIGEAEGIKVLDGQIDAAMESANGHGLAVAGKGDILHLGTMGISFISESIW